METAMPITRKLASGDNLGTHGIQVDVIDHARHRFARLEERGEVAPLEEMTVLPAETIKPRRESCLQPLHASREVGASGAHRQVKVISHDHIRVQDPAKSLAGLEQASFEDCLGPRCCEHVGAVVAPVDDVVAGVRELKAGWARHGVPS